MSVCCCCCSDPEDDYLKREEDDHNSSGGNSPASKKQAGDGERWRQLQLEYQDCYADAILEVRVWSSSTSQISLLFLL